MAYITVYCPRCHSSKVVKRGKTKEGKQRYLCLEPECPTKTFILDYSYNAYFPEVQKKIIDMAQNGSGVRKTARILHISPSTVISKLRKTKQS